MYNRPFFEIFKKLSQMKEASCFVNYIVYIIVRLIFQNKKETLLDMFKGTLKYLDEKKIAIILSIFFPL